MSDSDRGTLHTIAENLALAFEPLEEGFRSADDFKRLMYRLGWDVNDLPPGYAAVADEAVDLIASALALGDDPAVSDIMTVVVAAGHLIQGISGLNTAPAGVVAADFLAEMPERLVELLLVEYLARALPQAYRFLEMTGVIVHQDNPPQGNRPGFVRSEIRWAEIPKILTEPQTLPERVYGWTTDNFNFPLLASHLHELLLALDLRATLKPVERSLADGLQTAGAESRIDTELHVPVFEVDIASQFFDVGLKLLDLPAEPPFKPGMVLVPDLPSQISLSFDVADDLTFTVRAGSDIAETFGIAIRPEGVELRYPFAPGTQLPSAGFGASLAYHPATPSMLFGRPNASRLELAKVVTSLGVDENAGDIDVSLGLDAQGLAVVISPGEVDLFLAQVLGGKELRIEFPFGFAWSAKKGFSFTAALGLEASLRPALSIGPLSIPTLDLAIRAGADQAAPPSLSAQVKAGLGFELGPVTAAANGMGVELVLTFEEGNAGPFDVSYQFLPPNAIGLELDTPTVRLGGFLKIDTDNGVYAGAVEISIVDTFDLAAIGIITTRMPDGSEGFSLLFIISMVFPVPIPLSYNFYLAGVGGMLGLHRSVSTDHLLDGVRSGGIDHILFPTDVVKNMDAIITDLNQFFPVERNQFLVGPLALITWSSPPLIAIKLGLIIEFANPIRLVILGVLRASIPDPDEAVLDLKVAFMGAIDFQRGLLSFDASIYDSYIGTGDFKLSIEGDIVLRLSWGEQKDFVSSVGGFHPLYKPQAFLMLPKMKRITLSLLKENPRLRLTCYFALTTNTVQFGAQLDFYFGVSGFSVEGQFGFDVLFQFSPFHFIANVRAMLAVKAGGSDILSLSLEFELQGTTPWIAKGHAKFSILFFSVTVSFEKTFGDDAQPALPDVALLPVLLEEMGRDANWTGELSSGATVLVTLRPLDNTAGQVVVDTAGVLSISQRALPLETELTLFNNAHPTDLQSAKVFQVKVGGAPIGLDPSPELFAPASFRPMSDRDKLTASAYELRPGGARASGDDTLNASFVLHRPVSYEVLISDEPKGSPVDLDTPLPRSKQVPSGPDFVAWAQRGAVSRSQQSKARAVQRQKKSVLATSVNEDRFAVVNAADLTLVSPEAEGLTRSQADVLMTRLGGAAAPPTQYLVVPNYRRAA